MDKTTLIAVPSMDMVPMLFAQSLAMLEKPGKVMMATQISSLIYSARNNLAASGIKQNVDQIFWLDSDMIFPTGTLVHMDKLLEEYGADTILTGMYFRRRPPYAPVLYSKLDFDAKGNCAWEEVNEIPEDPFEVQACGFGCVLAPTKAFKDVQEQFGNMFSPIHGTGEDLSFCWRARKCGYKIICDPRIVLGHYGHTIIDRNYWEDYIDFLVKQGEQVNG